MFADSIEGLVRIPAGLVQEVVAWLERRGDSEEQVKQWVKAGGKVEEAFSKFRL